MVRGFFVFLNAAFVCESSVLLRSCELLCSRGNGSGVDEELFSLFWLGLSLTKKHRAGYLPRAHMGTHQSGVESLA